MSAQSKNSRRALLGLSLAGLAGAAPAQSVEGWSPKKEVPGLKPGQSTAGQSSEAPLLSSVIRSGHLLFLSGIGGWYPERRPEPGDARVQIQSALEIMKTTLERAGSSMDNVLKVTVALVEPEKNWELMNEGYKGFFGKIPPVRSYFGATGFRRQGQLLQVEAIAYVD